jgi:hypothetical protein
MVTITLDDRTLTVRPLTLGDVRALGAQWATSMATLERLLAAEPMERARLLPELIEAAAPCLCRMTGLELEAVYALPLSALAALLGVLSEGQRPPFPPATP